MKRVVLLLLLLAAGGVAGYEWWLHRPKAPSNQLLLYGNLDLRQVELAFNNNERIAAVLVQEGDRVQKGQLLARLDTSRLEPQLAQAQATVAAQRSVVERLHNGSRPEEVAQAQANVEAAKAELTNARKQYDRIKSLAPTGAASQQDLENAKAALDVADAKLAVNQKALDLELAGPRKEEIAENESRLTANEAQAAYLQQLLKDAQLLAPMDAVVRTRIMEPGDMASAQKPVFSLAIVDPKWVRAYVSERDLGHVHPGMTASVGVDSFPNRRFEGWVGFISPVAEFTPKPVETTELRTSLVYEVRVFVKDKSDDLRLGMPATVSLTREKDKSERGDADSSTSPEAPQDGASSSSDETGISPSPARKASPTTQPAAPPSPATPQSGSQSPAPSPKDASGEGPVLPESSR